MQHNSERKSLVIKRLGKQVIPANGATAENICEALPQLNAWGFRSVYDLHSDKRHEQLRAELLSYALSPASSINPCVKPFALQKLLLRLEAFERAQHWTTRSSYGLKHIFERETGVYVPDGLFILGALMAGFTARLQDNYQSAHFKMRRPAVR